MMDTNSVTNNTLTIREIFEQITILQKQLTENSQTSLHRLGEALSAFEREENEAGYEQIAYVCDVFKTRELTILKMLEFYERMYSDIVNAEEKKMNSISEVFALLSTDIRNSDLESADMAEAFADISTNIKMLAEQVLLNKTEEDE